MDDRERLWWSLPGPSRFVARVVDDLEGGRCVLLELPPHGLIGMRRTVRVSLQERGSLRSLRECDGTRTPEDMLGDLTGLTPSRGVEGMVRQLATAELVVWVHECTAATWGAWRSAVDIIGRLAGELPASTRLIIVVEVPPSERLPAADVAVRRHRWEGQVDADMLTWWCRLVMDDGPQEPASIRRLRAAMAAQVAVWDGDMAAELLPQVHLPQARADILLSTARRRGWKRTMPATWVIGAQMLIDQRPVVHSAWLAESERWDDIDRRIWAAQASVLMPVLDDMRMKIIRMHQRTLPTGLRDATGQIMSTTDYELGLLRHFIMTGTWRPQTSHYASVIQRAWGLRNHLAHLTPVDWQEADTLLRAGL